MKLYSFAILVAVNFVAPTFCAPDRFLVNDKSAELGDVTTVQMIPPENHSTSAPTTTMAPITFTITVHPTIPPTQPTSPITTSTTSTVIPTNSTTTTAPPTKITTTMTPGPKPTAPSSTTTGAPAPATTTTAPGGRSREFDGPSFIGGIILACGLSAIGFVGFKFYKARTERNYHTFYDSEL